MSCSGRALLIVAAVGAAIWSGAAAAPRVNGTVFDRAVPVQAFALDDHNGKAFTAETLKGRWSLILVGFDWAVIGKGFLVAGLFVAAMVTLNVRIMATYD